MPFHRLLRSSFRAIKQEGTRSTVIKQEEAAQVLASTPAQPPRDFAWNNCANKDLRTRVALKQQAVDDAFSHARQLRDQLWEGIQSVGPDHSTAFELMGGYEIRAWIQELIDLEYENQDLEILVGVAGVTGAGKTSLLNAILEYPELLPSSNTEAATATVCRIAWNYDDTEGHELRADVKFRSKEAIVQELHDVLTAVKDRKALREQYFEDEDKRTQAIDEMTDIISRGISKICAVWGLDEGEIEDMEHTVESVLADNDHIVNILGREMTMYSSDSDSFAAEVKPYLDSTPTPEGITAWPLIEEVRIYVKAEILKHGIVLVDLPGLSDMVEDRSAVAEGYYQNLAVTAIVTPAIRAVDEKTGVKLMGNHQELRMQLDGKYHKDSFCVVVSKIDDMDCDAFCKGSKEARQDAQLQVEAVEIKSVSNRSNETHKELRIAERKLEAMTRKSDSLKSKIGAFRGDDKKQRKAAKLKARRTALMKDRTKQLTIIRNLSNEAAQFDRTMTTLESRRKFRCVGIRNQYIKKRIQADFARRQRKLTRLAQHNRQRYDGSVPVFPVCAAAFRDLLKNKKPMPGFPSKLYTGVPRLRQWLGEAVFVYREEHLDSVLRGLQRLYDGIKCWSDDNSRGRVPFSRKEIETLLQSSHAKYQKKIGVALIRSADEIQRLSPLRNKHQKLASCKPMAVQAASRWVYKYPDDPNSTKKMNWNTYDTILKKDGGPFQSTGAGRPFYDFPLALGAPFLETLRDDWLGFFQVELPKTEEPMMAKASTIWVRYLHELRSHIEDTAPDIIPYFNATHNTLHDIETELSGKISSSIKSISEGSSQIHPLFIDSLRTGLIPVFHEALEIKGAGQFAHRQTHLRTALATTSPHLFNKAYTRMETAYKTRVHALPALFQRIAQSAVRQVTTHIGLLLNNLQSHDSRRADRTALGKKVRLQRAVKAGVLGWGAVWRAPDLAGCDGGGEVVGEGRLEIPGEFVEAVWGWCEGWEGGGWKWGGGE
ncbi:hypothetical protein C8A01DRAFT_32751 [Parachaetomium inaequale]|uniref:Dynamin N-terminal domain-containing protein n=1 Tax=Parachaetomium inaequale TaxID=2588326 RepID=A0AAN6PQH9_9PEZI|nr:hypothetical protein C8A01DRAFT_32751 [Parachaetomium inaequale]